MKNSELHKMQYYPKVVLKLINDVQGARQWAVALDKTMLTYFEVDPNCKFASQSHGSVQITMVI